MKTIMPKSIQDSPSKRHLFHWTTKVSNEEEENPSPSDTKSSDVKQEEDPNKIVSPLKPHQDQESSSSSAAGTSRQGRAVSRLKSVVSSIRMNRITQLLMKQRRRLGTKVVGTLFGYRRGGNLHFAVQKDSTSEPVFLVELAVPISGLVREMASDLVRITLECDKGESPERTKGLLDESVWRTYCDGKKCGLANRRECGVKEWEILKSVEPISIGAGVLRIEKSDGGDGGGFSAAGEIMYLRATFERVVGSRDSEAFYMMDPDTNGAPELGLYLLRV